MSYHNLDHRLLAECRRIPPDFSEILSLIHAGADVNASDEEETLLSEIILGYPDCPPSDDGEGRKQDGFLPGSGRSAWDGRYLPQIVSLFLRSGYDVTRQNGGYGGKCLQNLTWSSKDKYILEAAKALLHAGANPNYSEEGDTVLSWVALKESAALCADKDHRAENLFGTLYEIMDACLKGENFDSIRYYKEALGKRIERIFLCGTCDPENPVFDAELRNGQRYSNCFSGTVVFVCQGLPLCITKFITVLINPNLLPRQEEEKTDLSRYFPECVGQVLQSIGFGHREIRKGHTRYLKTRLTLRLGNGRKISFTNNHGEVSQEDLLSRFEVTQEIGVPPGRRPANP